MSLTNKRIYKFGEFELRVRARLLARDGKPVPLGSKAFEVLTCLVMHSGEVVTKEELLKTVWPESFVEEGNLSQHVFALRKALGDRACYIVTVPGRGYQFTEPVTYISELPPLQPPNSGSFLLQRTRERTHIVIEETAQAQSGPPSQEALESPTPTAWSSPQSTEITPQGTGRMGTIRSSLQVAVHETAAEGFSQHETSASTSGILALPAPPRHTRAWLWTGAALIVLLGAWFSYRGFARLAPANQKVVLADLDNRTGDPGLDGVLRQTLEIDLDQSPYIDVMGEGEALSTLRLMGRAPETVFVPTLAREVCERSNRQVLVTGSVTSLGNKYLIALKATSCISDKTLAGAKAEVASKDDLLSALDSASASLRHGLGESAESLQRFQVPIAQATTSSLEALKQYSTGEYLLGRMEKEQTEVLPLFQRAFELDPQFAMASVAIATAYFSLGEYKLAAPYYQMAFDLSDHVSERERLYIRAHYYADDKRDVRQGLQAYRMWAEVYPRDWGPWLNIANGYAQLGQFDSAVAAAEHALSLDPSRGITYYVLARNYMRAGRYADAESTVAKAHSIGKNSHLLQAILFQTALLEHDGTAMDRAVAANEGKEGQWELLELQALAAASDGRSRHSEVLFDAAHEAAIRENLPGKADSILIAQASAELDAGMATVARSTLRRVTPHDSDNPEVPVLLAELGDIAPAQHALAALSSPTSQDTMLTYVYGPRTRAEIALHQARPLQAIAELLSAADDDFSDGYSVVSQRAEAYLQSHQPDQAANEYRKILDHPGVDPVSPLLPLAQLGIARAEAQAGQSGQSLADYEKLLAQWKQADPDLPILLTARREYLSLKETHLAANAIH